MLTLADQLLLLAFELRLAGRPADRVTVLYVRPRAARGGSKAKC